MLTRCIISTLLVFSCITGFSAQNKSFKDSTTVIIRLANSSHNKLYIDSVYLIFDRYDRRGAGVVKKIFYPIDNTVKVTVPKGKYFVNIVCLGTYANEYFDRIINAKSDKEKTLSLKLEEFALFTPGFVFIPEEKVDFSNLSITRTTSFIH